MPVFVDTVAWIALANKRDSLHHSARDEFERLWEASTSFVTSEFVLIELGNSLCSPSVRSDTANFIQNLRRSQTIEIIPASSELFDRALDLFARRSDKSWSLVDCASFVIMDNMKIVKAFTMDHHFEQAGFEILL